MKAGGFPGGCEAEGCEAVGSRCEVFDAASLRARFCTTRTRKGGEFGAVSTVLAVSIDFSVPSLCAAAETWRIRWRRGAGRIVVSVVIATRQRGQKVKFFGLAGQTGAGSWKQGGFGVVCFKTGESIGIALVLRERKCFLDVHMIHFNEQDGFCWRESESKKALWAQHSPQLKKTPKQKNLSLVFFETFLLPLVAGLVTESLQDPPGGRTKRKDPSTRAGLSNPPMMCC